MGKVKCGICNTQKSSTDFYCASCLNFRLLKHRLNLIHVQTVNQTAIKDINNVLDLCFGEGNRDFLLNYASGKQSPPISSVNNDAIARLAFMLMNVNTITHLNQLDKIWTLVEQKRIENDKMNEKLKLLRERKSKLQKIVDTIKGSTKDETDIGGKYMINQRIVDLQVSIIDKERCQLLFNVLEWWNVSESRGRISIMSIPIVPVTGITNYQMSLILESFLKTCQFLQVISKILGIRLVYEMGTKYNELRVGDKVLKFKEITQFSELSHFGQKEFCLSISKIIQNLIIILVQLDPKFRTEEVSFHDVLRFDKLLIRIIDILKKKINYDQLKKRVQIFSQSFEANSTCKWKWFCKENTAPNKSKQQEAQHLNQPQDTTFLFQNSLEFASLSNPLPALPPTLPPSAIDAWSLLSTNKLAIALIELLVLQP